MLLVGMEIKLLYLLENLPQQHFGGKTIKQNYDYGQFSLKIKTMFGLMSGMNLTDTIVQMVIRMLFGYKT